MTRSIFSRREETLKNSPKWHTKTLKIFLPLVLTQKKHLSSSIQNIWATSIPMSAGFNAISTWQPWRLSLGCSLQIAVVEHLTQQFKLLLVSLQASRTSLAKIIFHVWFLVGLTKIHISEWQGMSAINWKPPNQQAFILSFSLLFKASEPKCQHQSPTQESLWLISQRRSKTK